MKKILFSFLAVFSIFIALNSCQAHTITFPSGENAVIDDKYYIYLGHVFLEEGEEVLFLSEQKGIFKLEWDSSFSDYVYKFYPEGSSVPGNFNLLYSDHGYIYTSDYAISGIFSKKTEIFLCNTNIVYGSKLNPNGTEKEGDIFYQVSEPDISIGDPTSKLQLTYEYNEELTECKINATIIDGSFTDKIFYSNYQPGISGELLTKKGFPRERNNCYRKSIFILSSRR